MPLDAKTNTPTFLTSPGSFHYKAFEATCIACDASASHLRQHVTYDPLLRKGNYLHDPEFFIADEDINTVVKDKWEDEAVSSDEETVQISNISHNDVTKDDICPIHPTGKHKWGECSHNLENRANRPISKGILTFSTHPNQADADQENDALTANDDQAELLRRHHRLGHLPFSMLKSLAKSGEIPKKFAKVKEPRCAGCLFGKMTKVPW